MSEISVRNAIKKAVAYRESDGCDGPRVTTREANAVLREAKKNGVTVKEYLAVGDFFQSRAPASSGGGISTRACPEGIAPRFDVNAAKNVEAFINSPAYSHLPTSVTLAIPENP